MLQLRMCFMQNTNLVMFLNFLSVVGIFLFNFLFYIEFLPNICSLWFRVQWEFWQSCLREKHDCEKHTLNLTTPVHPSNCVFLGNLYMIAQSAIEPLSIGYLPIDIPWSVTCMLFIHAMTVNSQGKAEHRLTRTAKASGYILIPSLSPLPAAHNNL